MFLFKANVSFYNKKASEKIRSFVPRTGIEPAHPCEQQILSLLRIPIPPSGLFNWGANIGVMYR